MNENILKQLVGSAMDQFLETDSYLLEHDVHEQAITSKIACYLERQFESGNHKDWHIDVEYNRNREIPKSLRELGNVKPDIIIHRRGLNNNSGTEDNNLLIIETKKNPTPIEREEDIRKVNAFVTESPYHYMFGAFISLNSNSPEKWNIDQWITRH